MSTLYHYTCQHGQDALSVDPYVRPTAQLVNRSRPITNPAVLALVAFCWFTDLDQPVAPALGLTRRLIDCDRTRYRWRVEPATLTPARYLDVRRTWFAPEVRDLLEAADGAMPAHWWVAREPVRVIADPIRRAAS